MLTARTKTIERTGTGRQFPPSLGSLSATKFSLQIYMEPLISNYDLNLTMSNSGVSSISHTPEYESHATNLSVLTYLKADFHSAENIARSTFSAHFLLNYSNQIQISEHISKESEREKSIARHFPLNGNPPLNAYLHDTIPSGTLPSTGNLKPNS